MVGLRSPKPPIEVQILAGLPKERKEKMYHFYEKYELVDIYKVIDKREIVSFSFRYDGHSYTCRTLCETYDLIKLLKSGEKVK